MHPTHKETAIQAAILTVSDTRTKETDRGGQTIATSLKQAKFHVSDYQISKDEPAQLLAILNDWLMDTSINTIIITGGTGFTSRDQTYDTIAPLFEKEMIGFGELFRQLSYVEIGPKAMFSRATAGCCQQTAIYLLPGSQNAVALAMSELILPTVQHFVGELHRQ